MPDAENFILFPFVEGTADVIYKSYAFMVIFRSVIKFFQIFLVQPSDGVAWCVYPSIKLRANEATINSLDVDTRNSPRPNNEFRIPRYHRFVEFCILPSSFVETKKKQKKKKGNQSPRHQLNKK